MSLESLLQNVVKSTESIKENDFKGFQNEGSKIKFLFINEGDTYLKLLPNPKSNSVLRKVRRHSINPKLKVRCMSEEGKPCKICKLLEDIEALTGKNLWKYEATSRYIFYAIYHKPKGTGVRTASVDAEDGETVLVMVPYSVGKSIAEKISEHPKELLINTESNLIKIHRGKPGSNPLYETSIDPFEKRVVAHSDKEYEVLLDELPDLNEVFYNTTKPITDEELAQYEEAYRALSLELNAGKVVKGASSVDSMIKDERTAYEVVNPDPDPGSPMSMITEGMSDIIENMETDEPPKEVENIITASDGTKYIVKDGKVTKLD